MKDKILKRRIKISCVSIAVLLMIVTAVTALNMTDEAITYANKNKQVWNPDKERLEIQTKFGSGDWFVYNAVPVCRMEDSFLSVFDFFTGVGWNLVISERAYRVDTNGGATWTSIDDSHGGMRISTAGITNRWAEFGLGDSNNYVYSFNVSDDIYYNLNFRANTNTNELVFCGLYNKVTGAFTGIRLNTAVDNNWYFVTNDTSSETTTSLGASDNEWHEFWMSVNGTIAEISFDQAPNINHTTNLPSDLMTPYIYIQTYENQVKNFGVRHLVVLQNAS